MRKTNELKEHSSTGIKCLTLGGGRSYFKRAEIPCVVCDAKSAKVCLGPVGKEVPAEIAKFSLLFEDGTVRENCEYGRDFVFAPKDSETANNVQDTTKKASM